MIVALKAIHITALIVWCAGLVALPLMLRRVEPQQGQTTYARLRKITHFGYTRLVTPAAVIAVAAGIALIFLRETYTAWMIAKLASVGLLVCVHGFEGHVVLLTGEKIGDYDSPRAALMIVPALLAMMLVLLFVLAKPDFSTDIFPEWLTTPRDRQLPSWEAVPI